MRPPVETQTKRTSFSGQLRSLRHPALHLPGDVHAAGAAIEVAEGFAGVCHHRIVEDRDEALRVGHDGLVEDGLVAGLELHQIAVLVEFVLHAVEVVEHALDLAAEGFDGMRQKALEAERCALFAGVGRALVPHRIVQEGEAGEIALLSAVEGGKAWHCRLPYLRPGRRGAYRPSARTNLLASLAPLSKNRLSHCYIDDLPIM